MNKSVEKPDDIYLLLDSFSLKSGLINTEFEFFKDYIIDIENYADKSLNNEFKIFTEGFVECGQGKEGSYKKINWQKDQLSGFEWDVNCKSKSIIFGIGENEKKSELRKYIGAEIKYPWELGRQQDLLNLAIFYSITENEEKKQEIVEFYKNRILDFSENNPIGFGVQWQTSMDIAIRAVNYLVSYDIFISKGAEFNAEFDNHFTQLIISHYFYIFDNLEFSDGMRGNHYFANLMGLITIYSYLDLRKIEINEKNRIDDIFYFALNSFNDEILYQFLNDGGNFEASIPYHYFATEMLLVTLNFLEKLAIIDSERIKKVNDELMFSDNLRVRITNIIDFSTNFLIEKYIPNIGDNDSGIVLDFMPYHYKKASLIWLLSKFDIEIDDDTLKYEQIKSVTNRLQYSNQTYFLADWFGIARASNKHFDLIAFAGGKGQNGKGGHSHNDKCSFELYVDDKPLIVDLGCAFYTSNWKKRNYYRSVRQHNVLHIGKEQELILDYERDDLFWLYGNKSKAKIVFANNEKIKLSHSAYKNEYSREITINDTLIEAVEKLDINCVKIVSFHFSNLASLELKEKENEIEIKFNDKVLLFRADGELSLKKCFYSPEYGIEIESTKIEIRSKNKEIKWKLELIED